MSNLSPDLKKVTELWRKRLDDAKLRVDFARQYKKEVERDFPAGSIPTPDGNFAVHRALRAENVAMAEYNRVLRIYGHLILHGEVPDEGDFSGDKTDGAGGE